MGRMRVYNPGDDVRALLNRGWGEDCQDAVKCLLESQQIPFEESDNSISEDTLRPFGCFVSIGPTRMPEAEEKQALLDFTKKGGGTILALYRPCEIDTDLVERLFGGTVNANSRLELLIDEVEAKLPPLYWDSDRRVRVSDFRSSIPLRDLRASYSRQPQRRLEYSESSIYTDSLSQGVDQALLEENLSEQLLFSFAVAKRTSECFLRRDFKTDTRFYCDCTWRVAQEIAGQHHLLSSVDVDFQVLVQKVLGQLLQYSLVGVSNQLQFGKSKNILLLSDLLTGDLTERDTALRSNARMLLNLLNFVGKCDTGRFPQAGRRIAAD